jgi:1-deoxy-D-xylulose-5-phosphate reductoisomerase
MMNKGLELIEARWLFDIPQENIDIVIHRESVVHSLVEFTDYSVLAQMGVPDMCIPIQYALTWPCRYPSPVKRISLTDIGKLTFYKPDYEAFPCMDICRRSLQQGGAYPAAINAANEVANERFRLGEISYPKLTELVAAALERSLPTVRTEQDILAVDAETRVRTLELIK